MADLGKIGNSGEPAEINTEPSAFNATRWPRCSDSTTPSRVTSARTSPANLLLIFGLSL
jgi:hypothetical protein